MYFWKAGEGVRCKDWSSYISIDELCHRDDTLIFVNQDVWIEWIIFCQKIFLVNYNWLGKVSAICLIFDIYYKKKSEMQEF